MNVYNAERDAPRNNNHSFTAYILFGLLIVCAVVVLVVILFQKCRCTLGVFAFICESMCVRV